MKLTFRAICLLSLFLTAAFTGLGGDEPPTWVRQAASVKLPAFDKEVPAVVLHKELQVTLDSEGKLITVENYAVKVLSREGKRIASADALYLVSSGKVREIEAWMIRPDGTTRSYGKKDVIDHISDPDDVYDEYRVKTIDASRDVDTGYVFAYTVVSEERPLYFQEKWFTQDDLPTLISRYTLNLPTGWTATSLTFNHPEVKPQRNGTTFTWELRDLPFIRSEPMSPSVVNLVPWLAISYSPEDRSQAVSKSFVDWTEVSRWTTAMYDPQVVVNDEVAGKARELTANAKTELERIHAIANYVQNLQYISIDIGVGRGNGIRPRPSDLVLSRGYGDCKDKANLMRAMLRSLKIEAYPVAIFSGDSTFVREEWASPGQFNHCIIAIRISDSTDGPTVINHAKLGRLLIFDATDRFTPVGDLPDDEQGSLALIIAGENGGLTRMPVIPATFNTWDRDVEITLSGDGNIKGTIKEQARGQQSTYARALFRSLPAGEFNKAIEGWLTRGATAANLIKVTPNDNQADARFNLDVEFAAPRYGQLMQDRLLVFKPAIVSRSNSVYLTEKTRDHPVILDEDSFNERTVFTLPDGFVVDEMPEPVSIETAFGKYAATYEVKEGKLLFSRSMNTKRSTIAVDKYEGVRSFFSKIRDAEQSPVVLLRK